MTKPELYRFACACARDGRPKAKALGIEAYFRYLAR